MPFATMTQRSTPPPDGSPARKPVILVNAIPMVRVSTGIGRYIRALYTQMERLYGHEADFLYFDGRHAAPTMPKATPAKTVGWAKWVDLLWKLPWPLALLVRLTMHARRELAFRRCARHADLYHETAFFPFARPAGLPTVFTIHDLSLLRFPEHHPTERVKFFNRFFLRRLKLADRFLAVSEFTRREMWARLRIPESDVTVTPLAHDAAVFRPQDPEAVAETLKTLGLPERYFLFVGSGDPRKNAGVIPKALAKSGLDIPLVSVGWSGWGDAHTATTEGATIIPLGYVDDATLAQLYAGCLAMIYPSLYEGFGLPVIEALACGAPVVAARRASLPEAGGPVALYLETPEDPAELAIYLKRLAEAPAQRATLAAEGVKWAHHYDWTKTARATYAVMRGLLRERAHGAGTSTRAPQGVHEDVTPAPDEDAPTRIS